MHVAAHIDVDVIALEQDDTVSVLLELQAPAATSAPRPPQSIVVVLDRSGSMGGPRLVAAKEALLRLIDRLDPNDQLGVVVFDDESQVVLPARKIIDHDRAIAKRAVRQIQPGGQTDLSSGYLRGLQEARRVAGETGATLILLSDGQANSGITDPAALQALAADAYTKRITTSTIGIGDGYDDRILAAQAAGGNGNHSFAERPEAAATALAAEVEGLLTKTAQAASVLIKPGNDISGITVLNDLASAATSDGILVDLGDFYAAEVRRLVLQIEVPGRRDLGLAQIAELQFRYVELPSLTEHTVTVPLSVNVLPGDEAAGRIRKPEVERERLLLQAQTSKLDSEAAMRYGDVTGALASLSAGHEMLAEANIDDPALLAETAWFEESVRLLTERDANYNLRRSSSSRNKISRGQRERGAGGEVE